MLETTNLGSNSAGISLFFACHARM